jgi:hypothetical protein
VLYRVAIALLVVGLLGCEQRVDDGSGSSDGEFLRMQGFSIVAPEEGRLRGFMRWMFLEQDPASVDDPTVSCEIWEELDLYAVEVDDACPECEYQFEGRAQVEDNTSTTCTDVDWSQRSFTLGWGPLASQDPEVAALADEGYSHAVHTRWSPELGESEGFQSLFAAKPNEWEADEAGGEGTGADEVLAGQHELFCLFFWEL